MEVFTVRKALILVISWHMSLAATAKDTPKRSGRDQERHKISVIVDREGNTAAWRAFG